MDFSNRTQSQAGAQPAASAAGTSRRTNNNNGRWGRIAVVAAVAAIVIILLGVIIVAARGGGPKESSYVDSAKLQAVFLNTGQVYFGNIKTLNNKYVELTNIYYLQTSNGSQASQTTANTSVSLVKLGCELHEPFDKMLINRDQVTFWENLQDGGQVAKAVSTFEKQNPNGQKCADQSSASSSNSSNSAQPANNGSGTPATTTKP
jgi:hypothetical protein